MAPLTTSQALLHQTSCQVSRSQALTASELTASCPCPSHCSRCFQRSSLWDGARHAFFPLPEQARERVCASGQASFHPLLSCLALKGALCPFLLHLHPLCVTADSATLIVSRESCLLGMPGPNCRQGDHSDVSPVTMTLCVCVGPYPIRHPPVSAGVKWLLGESHLGGSLVCAEPGLRWDSSLEIICDKLAKDFVACWPGSECLCYRV